MATVVGERDKLIMGAANRYTVANNRGLFLNPSSAIFKIGAGGGSPSSYTFVPNLLNLTGAVSWSSTAGLTLTYDTSNNAVLTYANMSVDTGSVTASITVDGTVYSSTATIQKVADGALPKLLDVVGSSQVFQISKSGTVGPSSIALKANPQNLAGSPNWTVPVGSVTLSAGADNWQKSISYANMTTDVITVQVAQDGLVDQITIIKVREGADSVNVFLTNENQTLGADNAGSVASYSGASTTMKIYIGATDDSANSWTYSAAPASSAASLQYTLNAATGVVTITAMNSGVDSAYVDITATKAGNSLPPKRFTISKSKTGAQGTGTQGTRGNLSISAVTTGSVWSDTEANAAIVNAGGTSARSRDVVNLYRADRTWAERRVFDGFNWTVLAESFNGSILVKGSVLADTIDSRGLDIKNSAGAVILKASETIAQQTKTNVNLAPRISDWPVGNRYTGAYAGSNSANANSVNGEFIVLPDAAGYVGYESDSLRIPANAYYTVSFDAQCDASRDIRANLYGPNVDTAGVTITLTNQWKHFVFTDIMTVADAPNARLRIFGMNRGAMAYVANVKVEMGTVASAWTDDFVTPSNVTQRVLPGSIGDTQIGGDLKSTDWNGIAGPTGTGWLLQRSGNLYANSIALRGSVSGGDYDGYAWVHGNRADGTPKRGYYLGPEGLLMGNPDTPNWVQIENNGNVWSKNFTIIGGVPTFSNAIINNPSMDTFTASFSGGAGGSYGNGSSGYGTLTVVPSGGKSPYRVQWVLALVSKTGAAGNMVLTPNGMSASFSGSGTNATLDYAVTAVVTDANNRTYTLGTEIVANHGTPI